MNVLLMDIDSKIPNLPLKKLEIYHKNAGHKGKGICNSERV